MNLKRANELWKIAEDLKYGAFTPRVWIEVGEQAKASNYEKFKGMSAEEIYAELQAQVAPLDALVKAVSDAK